jgi:Ran GTPase-activating protein (RanGAP) involved in mRNA processing and transport
MNNKFCFYFLPVFVSFFWQSITMTVLHLPSPLWSSILSFVDPREQAHLSLVCKQFLHASRARSAYRDHCFVISSVDDLMMMVRQYPYAEQVTAESTFEWPHRALLMFRDLKQLILSGGGGDKFKASLAFAAQRLCMTSTSLVLLRCEEWLDYTTFSFLMRGLLTNHSIRSFFASNNYKAFLNDDRALQSAAFVQWMMSSSIQTLDLSHCGFSVVMLQALSFGLQHNRACRSLNLKCIVRSPYLAGDDFSIDLAEALSVNSALEHLDVSANGISKVGLVALAEAVSTNKQSCLLSLNCLFDDPSGDFGDNEKDHLNCDDDGVVAWCVTLQQPHTRLQKLDFSSQPLGDRGARALALALLVNTTLKECRLANHCIGPVGAEALASALCTHPLEVLSLNALTDEDECDVRDEGFVWRWTATVAESWSKTLQSKTTQLRCLDLSNHLFRDQGAILLATALGNNTKLTQLVLKSNGIQQAGAIAFARLFSLNTTLVELNLFNNALGKRGIEALVAALANSRFHTDRRLVFCPLQLSIVTQAE